MILVCSRDCGSSVVPARLLPADRHRPAHVGGRAQPAVVRGESTRPGRFRAEVADAEQCLDIIVGLRARELLGLPIEPEDRPGLRAAAPAAMPRHMERLGQRLARLGKRTRASASPACGSAAPARAGERADRTHRQPPAGPRAPAVAAVAAALHFRRPTRILRQSQLRASARRPDAACLRNPGPSQPAGAVRENKSHVENPETVGCMDPGLDPGGMRPLSNHVHRPTVHSAPLHAPSDPGTPYA